MRVIERIQLCILAVDRQRVLCQIVCSNTEEINFFRKITADHDRRRRLDHNTEFHVILIRNSFILQFRFHLCDDLLDPVDLTDGNDHRKHDRNIAIDSCAVERAELRLEDLRPCQADTDRPVSERRVLFFVKPEIVYLLISADVQCSDNDFLPRHVLCNLLINRKLLFL